MLVIKKQILQSLSRIIFCDHIKVQEFYRCFLKFLNKNTKDEMDFKMLCVAGTV